MPCMLTMRCMHASCALTMGACMPCHVDHHMYACTHVIHADHPSIHSSASIMCADHAIHVCMPCMQSIVCTHGCICWTSIHPSIHSSSCSVPSPCDASSVLAMRPMHAMHADYGMYAWMHVMHADHPSIHQHPLPHHAMHHVCWPCDVCMLTILCTHGCMSCILTIHPSITMRCMLTMVCMDACHYDICKHGCLSCHAC
jgi:hypothetical protein